MGFIMPAGPEWSDWRWQQRAARPVDFLPEGAGVAADERFRSGLTPYFARLVEESRPDDAARLRRQVARVTETDAGRPDRFDGLKDNWETESEFLTPLLHKKYPDRAVVRIVNRCHSYCTFCLEALRVLDRSHPKDSAARNLWEDTLARIREHGELREIILSGGDPLLLEDDRLEKILRDLRSLSHIETIRIHTRALSFNPFRVTKELAAVLRRYDVTEVGLNVVHPAEITHEFRSAVGVLLESHAILQAHTPLLRGVNDDPNVLEKLFRGLYRLHVRPYYLIHCVPFVPAVTRFRTSVRRGVELLRSLKRRVSNPAVPEYIVVHETGKQTVPLDPSGGQEFQYVLRGDGWPLVRFLNWRGDWVDYLDSPDDDEAPVHPT